MDLGIDGSGFVTSRAMWHRQIQNSSAPLTIHLCVGVESTVSPIYIYELTLS
jgi:hypothetical protein